MKKLITSITFLCAAFFVFGAPPKGKRIVMISLDGISVAGFEKAHTPNLDRLMAEGSLSMSTRVVMPSVTLPNWTSHLTGSGPEQHGIVDNGWQIDKIKLPSVVKDEQGYYPSVFTVVKKEVPRIKTAFYYNWINLFYPHNKKNFDEVSYLDDDAYIQNYTKAFDFIVKNKKDPTLVFLYSVHTDHAGHKHKWMSPEYIKSIEEADIQIGLFLDKLKKENLYEDTHFMFLSDHGGIEFGHGGVTVDEMIVPWGITGPGIKKGFKIEQPNNTVNTASTILYLLGVKQPLAWTGQVPLSVFK
ncbi:alkaline phosphatase family protein [Sphingobacterium psychroaquaticum]|uniref:alkaline phosphatase family protein n=1 Tax=Sphingobacterium psychroaquaticum TaxID=561061 RepID=UPI001068E9F3|nr:ectonucleotide pyrophosphatase/phosphodiesterase [Sphingobacterium psychroaquaticum]QBQ39931.1 alkaline phosphatase family protein [Sphingobacterium psychroaquaticum]